METKELIENLSKDLAELQINKKAHIQIENILAHYKANLEEEDD